MRKGILCVLGSWLFAAAPILAQSTPSSPSPSSSPSLSPAPAPALSPAPSSAPSSALSAPAPTDVPVATDVPVGDASADRYWVQAEYLAYWVKSAPTPISLVTGDPANPTQELLSSDRSLGMFSGFRVGGGAWLDSTNVFGWDGNFFMLFQRSSNFSASSDGSGNPTLAFPFTNQTPGASGDNLMPIAMPGVFAGSVQIANSLQLLGAETNGIVSLARWGGLDFVGMVGFRFVDLRESLNIGTVSSDLLTSPNTVLSQSDQFKTANQFYGAQIGSRIEWQNDRFGVDLTGKLAIGETHQSVDISGVSTQTGPGGINGTFPGGFFAQNSNIGRNTADRFSIIPTVEAKFSVFITPQLRAFVGYDLLYWTDVVRPGSQIDRNINLSQSNVLGAGSLSGPAYPAAQFSHTDFWAQGLNLGMELRF